VRLAADLEPVVFLDGRGRSVVLAATREDILRAEAEARLGGPRYEVSTLVVEHVSPGRTPTGPVKASLQGLRIPDPHIDMAGERRAVSGDVAEPSLVLPLRAFAHYPVRADGFWFFLLGVTSSPTVLYLSLVWMLGANPS